MVRGLKAALGIGTLATWAAVGAVVITPSKVSAFDAALRARDQASCSSGACSCKVQNTSCGCDSGANMCRATCSTGQASYCSKE